MRRRSIFAVAALASALVLPGAGTASATDIVVNNFGFESGLDGWGQAGADGGGTVVTAPTFAGARSAKIVDDSSVNAAGLESTMPASAGGYAVYARAFVESGRPDLYLRYYNQDGDLLGADFNTVTGPLNQWTLVRTRGTAPAGTTRMTVIVYSSKGNTGTAYWDQVVITRAGAEVDLGVQVNNSAATGTTFGLGARQHLAYTVITAPHTNGTMAAKLAEIDVNSGTAVDRGALPGALGASTATTASDGSVYIGANVNGALYRYWPDDPGIANVGKAISSEEHIWALTPAPNRGVYGATSKHAGLFNYRPGEGFADLGSPIWVEPKKEDQQEYARSVAFDPRPGQEAAYVGLGYTKAALIRWDRATQERKNVLPAKYIPEGDPAEGVGGLTFTGDRLFAQVDSTMAVLSITKSAGGAISTVEEASFPSGTRDVSEVNDGKVYYLLSGQLHSYDIASRQVTPLGVRLKTKPGRLGWVRLADQATYPGLTLVGVGQHQGATWLFKYNPAVPGQTREVAVSGTPVLPNRLVAVETGPDGRIYSSGHFTGGLGTYRPLLGHGNDSLPAPDAIRDIDQIEGMLSYNGKLYLGVYPSARMYELTPGSNPVALPGMPAIGNLQDRPYALAAGHGKLFIGTVAYYGHHEGALTEYTIGSGAHVVHRNIIANQSITALAYHNGIVYGGSSIRPAHGAGPPKATDARFFTYNPATGAKVEHRLPGLTSVTALLPVDGRIWGVADNSLFVFNPATGTFSTNPTVKFTGAQIPSWKEGALVTTPLDPGNVYATVGHQLLKISKSTLAATDLHTHTTMQNLTVDEYGNLYYSAYDRLYRFAI